MRALRVSMWRKSRVSVCRAISASVPASSAPVGPAPITANVRQASRSASLVGGFRLFEGGQHAAPDQERVVERLEPGRELLPLIVSEVGVRGAARDEKVVVGDLAIGQRHLSRGGVDADAPRPCAR